MSYYSFSISNSIRVSNSILIAMQSSSQFNPRQQLYNPREGASSNLF